MLSGLNAIFLNRSKSHDLFIQSTKFIQSTAGRLSGGLATYTGKELLAELSIKNSNLLSVFALGTE